MRKTSIVILLILTGLILMACEEDGELRIRNRTNGLVSARVDGAASVNIDAWSGWSRFYTEDATVGVAYQGLYVYPDSTTRTVIKGLPTTVNVTPDAGALSINNDSTFVVTEVYISAHDDTEWGDNQLAIDLGAGGTRVWTLDEGSWDIKIVSDAGTPLYKMNQSVIMNETLALNVKEFLPFARKQTSQGFPLRSRRPVAR